MYGSQEQGGGMMDMLMQAMMSQPQSGYGQAGPAQMDEMGMAAQGMGGGQPSPTIGVSKMTEAGRLPRGYPGQAQQQQGGNENPFGDLMSNWNDTMATAGYGEDYGEDNGGSYLSEDQAQTGNQIWNIFSALYGGGSGGGGGG
jgi:hypothetical protein